MKNIDFPVIKAGSSDYATHWIERLTDGKAGPHGGHIAEEMQAVMMEKVGIYRNEAHMKEAVETITLYEKIKSN